MLLVSMLLEKQSVQAGVEAQSWERGVEKNVEKTKPDKMSSLKSSGAQPVFNIKVVYNSLISFWVRSCPVNSKTGPRKRYLKLHAQAVISLTPSQIHFKKRSDHKIWLFRRLRNAHVPQMSIESTVT